MSLVGDFWSHPNILYHYALLDLGLGPSTFKAIQDDLASIVILTTFSVIQGYLSFSIVRHLFGRHNLPRDSRKSPKFSIVAVVVSILYLVASVLAMVTFATKLFGAAKVTYYQNESQIPDSVMYMCVLVELYETCPLFFTYIPSPLASQLDIALGAVFQAVVILADGLLLYRCFVVFKDKPWLYGMGGVVYLASIVIPLVFAGLVYTYGGPMTYNSFDPRQRGFGDITISLHEVHVGTLTLLHVLILSIASSVLVNIMVAGSIAFRVIQAMRRWSKLKTDLVYVQSDRTLGKSAVLTILLEAALPPAILGIIICFMSVSKLYDPWNPTYTHFLRVLWVSLTALAPQLIAVRVAQGKTWEQQEESVVSRPLQFAMETVRSPVWLDLESPKPFRAE
ncbi:hypothetical protein BKA70DRAFT_1327109 [Coprinopsis sp. MPI-PUGE-AT-0042]|nr:hypothetical protein BKA70DRAFT_1327109 [Coprinopsis sp. MPI-PUGE-AT-0042]